MPTRRRPAVDLFLGFVIGLGRRSGNHLRSGFGLARVGIEAEPFVEGPFPGALLRIHLPVPPLLGRFLLERGEIAGEPMMSPFDGCSISGVPNIRLAISG
ncbi:hypothetical protein BMJ27_23555 [Sinorhizobium medicae]|nr:hypothetical protein BMJ27_23555 [Sinorhizobium medicae]